MFTFLIRPRQVGLVCSICEHGIREIRPGQWEHRPTAHSKWGPVCVMTPEPKISPRVPLATGPVP